ncbi:DUF3027 domain-containing protein [Parafrankia discariae]|uniref:DUF3027 domain-containing protein n=1 Tax=Parafrankia discariae TaxID=365528 RepID=UPI001E3932AB|nr:DUF3027 domain-containing protein [Parafrankia discariae]
MTDHSEATAPSPVDDKPRRPVRRSSRRARAAAAEPTPATPPEAPAGQHATGQPASAEAEPTPAEPAPAGAAGTSVEAARGSGADAPADVSVGVPAGVVSEHERAVPERSGPETPGPDAGPDVPATRARVARSGRLLREPVLDSVCAGAVDLARAAAEEEADSPAEVGRHLGVEAEAERLVLHRFECLSRAYVGWTWTVVVARASRIRKATVNDVVLTPGEGAVLAPAWVPWSERLRPGDVGVGDLLPTAVDDPRLALRASDAEEIEDPEPWMGPGIGRPRMLSAVGREEAAERWYGGDSGPDASIAKVAPATCLTCGFHVRLVGALGRLFGVCANELAPDDARVTAVDHGCGAHSEALVAPSAHPESVPFDEDPSDLTPTDIELVGVAAHSPGSVPDQPSGRADTDTDPGPEPYGHS